MSEEYMKKYHPELAEYYQKGDCCSWIVELRKQVSEKDKEIELLNNIINELEKWLKMIPKSFMDRRSFNNGVYIEQGMQKQIDLTLDKLKELKESGNNE